MKKGFLFLWVLFFVVFCVGFFLGELSVPEEKYDVKEMIDNEISMFENGQLNGCNSGCEKLLYQLLDEGYDVPVSNPCSDLCYEKFG